MFVSVTSVSVRCLSHQSSVQSQVLQVSLVSYRRTRTGRSGCRPSALHLATLVFARINADFVSCEGESAFSCCQHTVMLVWAPASSLSMKTAGCCCCWRTSHLLENRPCLIIHVSQVKQAGITAAQGQQLSVDTTSQSNPSNPSFVN